MQLCTYRHHDRTAVGLVQGDHVINLSAALGDALSAHQPMIGLIGGSGLYDMEGLEDRRWVKVHTPWGDPSDEILTGRLHGVPCAFLPRHGRGHADARTAAVRRWRTPDRAVPCGTAPLRAR